MRRGGLAMHHRWEKNTTDGAWGDRHAPSMREKYDGWGVGGSPRNSDERKIGRMGRGVIAMHHRWEKNTTGGAGGDRHAPSMGEKYGGWGGGGIAMHHRRENNTPGGAWGLATRR